MKKIKAYIVYGGSPEWYNATLIFENGWAAFGHCCSHPCFMESDLWESRKERQDILTKMGYEVEIHHEIFAGSDAVPKFLLEKYQDESNYKEMADEYDRIEKESRNG